MNPLCKWLLIVVAVLMALSLYGCERKRPVQIGADQSRNA